MKPSLIPRLTCRNLGTRPSLIPRFPHESLGMRLHETRAGHKWQLGQSKQASKVHTKLRLALAAFSGSRGEKKKTHKSQGARL